MKKILLIVSTFVMFVSVCFAFVGCDNGCYNFVGIISTEDNKTVISYKDITDADIKLFLDEYGYTSSKIDLKSKNKFSWSLSVGSGDFVNTTTITGIYEIDKTNQKIKLTSSSTGDAEKTQTISHDFIDGSIVVYLSGYFLVYQK